MTSTGTTLIVAMLAALAFCFEPVPAFAARPLLAVAPFAHESQNVRQGLAAVLVRELAYGGHFELLSAGQAAKVLDATGFNAAPGAYETLDPGYLSGFAGLADYLLTVEVIAFDVVTKEPAFDLGRKLGGLGQSSGLGGRVAQAALGFRLLRVSDGAEVLAFTAEGLESRHGRAVDVTQGWLSSTNFEGDEFRRTSLGRAFFKALGQALYELYAEYPVQGAVLAVAGDSVIIDLDQRAGVQLGDEIELLAENPIGNALGETVWRELEYVGSAKVVEFQPGRCLCVVLAGQGAILEGAVARPLTQRLVLPLEADREDTT